MSDSQRHAPIGLLSALHSVTNSRVREKANTGELKMPVRDACPRCGAPKEDLWSPCKKCGAWWPRTDLFRYASPRAARWSAKLVTRLVSTALPFSAVAWEGKPMTPVSVYAFMPRVSRNGRSPPSWSAVS